MFITPQTKSIAALRLAFPVGIPDISKFGTIHPKPRLGTQLLAIQQLKHLPSRPALGHSSALPMP